MGNPFVIRKRVFFDKVDVFIFLFFVLTVIDYDYNLSLAPVLLFTIISLGIAWFVCRLSIFLLPVLAKYVTFVILLCGLIEAVWGLGQLYDFFPSKHHVFNTTGSFFNSGPYGGFIALMFPLVLHCWITVRKENIILEYLFLAVGIVLLLVFPATLSRTAWLAAITGCLLVILFDTNVIATVKALRKRKPRKLLLITAIITVLVLIGAYGVFHIKKDSANGRLFIWKISVLAIKESPVQGVGLGGFPAAYAKAQLNYFKNGKGTETEKLVAGSPEYAFNEYLRISIEQGLLGVVIFLLLTFLIIRSGIRNKQTGGAGSFLALSVFAFASYPYYLWEFLVMWVVLGSVCVTKKGDAQHEKTNKRSVYFSISLLGLLLVGTILCMKQLQPYRQAKKEWEKIRPLHTVRAYQSAIDGYDRLYPTLNYDPKFVFEYAVTLNAQEQREKADRVLTRGLQLSCDPMFFNVKGRNNHEMGKYKEAETCYIHSTYLLPERIYPYYLLTKLYADSANYQPAKMRLAARAVLEKEPKVHSTAINEMRDEVRKILKSKEVENER